MSGSRSPVQRVSCARVSIIDTQINSRFGYRPRLLTCPDFAVQPAWPRRNSDAHGRQSSSFPNGSNQVSWPAVRIICEFLCWRRPTFFTNESWPRKTPCTSIIWCDSRRPRLKTSFCLWVLRGFRQIASHRHNHARYRGCRHCALPGKQRDPIRCIA